MTNGRRIGARFGPALVRIRSRLVPLSVTLALVVVASACGRSQSLALPTPTSVISTGPASSTGAPSAAPAESSVSAPQPSASFTATPIPAVSAATDLQQARADHQLVPPGGWVAGAVTLEFRADAPTGTTLEPQVEVVGLDQPFVGRPSTQAPPVASIGGSAQAAIILKDLAPGQYHWQARFEDTKNQVAGPWTTFSDGKTGFGLAGSPPTAQDLTLTGASHTSGGVPLVGANDHAVVHWTVNADPPAALDHFVEVADHQKTAPAAPPAGGTTIPSGTDTAPLGDLSDGAWYLHLWATDKAGQVGAAATLPVQVLRSAPQVDGVLFRTWATNPAYQDLPISFRLSHAATVKVSILPATGVSPLRTFGLGQQQGDADVQVSWNGQDAQGHVVPVGTYRFMVDAVDAAGNSTQGIYSGLTITDKVIKVSLVNESMTAYAGSQVFLTTLITSGGQALPTKPGQFEILSKQSPFVFHAQFPKGSPYWFPDVTSPHAMLFDQSDANFIHDAPWRSIYGPGTDGPGIPGQPKTGSHGCVETPGPAMARLYDWTQLGTPVIVSP